MKQKLFIAVISFLMLTFPHFLRAQSWNNITPLISKRSDVERIFGKCADRYSCLYKRENENVLINYTTGNYCRNEIFNVAKDTVLAIAVFSVPRGSLQIRDLNLDLNKFVVDESGDVVGVKALVNHDEGLTIEVRGETVLGMYFSPSEKNKQIFSCSNKSKSKFTF